MQTKTVTHADPELQVTVSEATALMGMRRNILISRAIAAIRDEWDPKEEDEPSSVEVMAQHFLRRYVYPNCLACLVKAQGFSLDLPFEEFSDLPDAFVAEWENMALLLNPHWRLQADEEDEEEAKKKEPSKDG